jgi:hypothetical protein
LRQTVHDAPLAALDAARDADFASRVRERHGAHLAQVHADGVVGLSRGAGDDAFLALVFLVVLRGFLRRGAEPLGPSCSRASASTTVMPWAREGEDFFDLVG